MTGIGQHMVAFMEGMHDRFIIPVYQRKYDWKIENCRRLYEDLKKTIRKGRPAHFFGSIVSYEEEKSPQKHHIIDGQQRLTTITLLLLAIRNLVASGKLHPQEYKRLDEQIQTGYLCTFQEDDQGNNIKLRPVESDRPALDKLFAADEEDYDNTSNLTANYNYFCDKLLEGESTPTGKGELSVDDVYRAINKLTIVRITLGEGDNPQRIFESLNSTGLALNEGDKIRNFVLMGLPPSLQREYHKNYWAKIESYASEDGDTSNFAKDYLSVKHGFPPVENKVYETFKAYVEGLPTPDGPPRNKEVLEELLRYARLYDKILSCKSGFKDSEVDRSLTRLKRLNLTTFRSFLMEVLWLCVVEKKISEDTVLKVLLITESYLFRRSISTSLANANKLFPALNREVLRHDKTGAKYVDVFIFVLLSKERSGLFPNDEQFAKALMEKDIYNMTGNFKPYLFDRIENYNSETGRTVDEYIDIPNLLGKKKKKGGCSIEHIMPQTLTPEWRESLRENGKYDPDEIHKTWLHRLANLFLTGSSNNSKIGNKPFQDKRVSYKNSHFTNLSKDVTGEEYWRLAQLEKRGKDLVEQAKKIWAYPKTDFVPAGKTIITYTLDNEDVDSLVEEDIVGFEYSGEEYKVHNWSEMFEKVLKVLHHEDKSVLSGLAAQDTEDAVSSSEVRGAVKIGKGVYVAGDTSTEFQISMLRRLFKLYGIEPSTLILQFEC